MSDILILSLIFVKIGFVAFGGGWSIVGLIQKELIGNGYISADEFAQAVSIAQLTPGPIAINIATYTGFKLGGIAGAVISTFSLLMPTLIILSLIGIAADFFIKDKKKAVKSLIPGTFFFMAYSLIQLSLPFFFDLSIYFIAVISFILIRYTKINPIFIIFISGFSSILLNKVLPLAKSLFFG